MWIFSDFENSDFFGGHSTYVNLGPFSEVGQAEAVCYFGNNEVFISSERIYGKKAKLYRMYLGE